MECLVLSLSSGSAVQWLGAWIQPDYLGLFTILICCFAWYCFLMSCLIFKEVTVLICFLGTLSTSGGYYSAPHSFSCNFVWYLTLILFCCLFVKLISLNFSNIRAPSSVDFRECLKIQVLVFCFLFSPLLPGPSLSFLSTAHPAQLCFRSPGEGPTRAPHPHPGARTAWILVLTLTEWVISDKSLALPIPVSWPVNWGWIGHQPNV